MNWLDKLLTPERDYAILSFKHTSRQAKKIFEVGLKWPENDLIISKKRGIFTIRSHRFTTMNWICIPGDRKRGP